jgi:hypothetical protein
MESFRKYEDGIYEAESAKSKLETLVSKGEVLNVPDYSACVDICEGYYKVLKQAGALFAFATNPKNNYDNPATSVALKESMSYSVEDMRKDIDWRDHQLTGYIKHYYRILLS